MMDAAAASVLPLKRYAVFRGRSTRTELLSFYVLVLIAAVGLGFASSPFGYEPQLWVHRALGVFLLCPSLALGVRRLHDSGRSGAWLLLAAPWLIAVLLDVVRHPGSLAFSGRLDLPWWIDVPLGLCGVALVVLLLRDDDPGDNPYGPNPRHGPVGEPA
jgi:uncharacterized membrane protein YhaH (DUF805 family)